MNLQATSSLPPLFLLHGGGLGPWSWNRHVQVLQNSFRCIVPPLPGHQPHAANTFDFVAARDELIAMLEQYDGQAVVAGLSLGGQLALDIVATRPDLVRRAVISGANVAGIPGLRFFIPLLPVMAPVKGMASMQRLSARTSSIPAEEIPDFCRSSAALTSAGLASIFRESAAYRLPSDAKLSKVLGLVGSKEPRVIQRSAATLAAHGAQVARVPGGKHTWPLAEPALFAGAVVAWAESSELPATLVA
jgi:pimeloyl-ACP methyl ester carboxylesterase